MRTINITATEQQAIELAQLLDSHLHELAVSSERAGAAKDSPAQNEAVVRFRQLLGLREQVELKGRQTFFGW